MFKTLSESKPIFSKFALFTSITFFIALSDAIMSYMAPVIIERGVKNAFLMGLIMSISSFFGMFFDFFIAQKLNAKNYMFFLGGAIFFALLFPLMFIFFPTAIIPLMLSMIIWSIYYEFRGFSQIDFIHRHLNKEQHTLATSVLMTIRSIAYLLGPGIAVYVLDSYINLPFYISIFFVLISYLLFTILKVSNHRNKKVILIQEESSRPLFVEFKILHNLLKKAWVLILFQTVLIFFEVAFWTTGILYTEELRDINPIGGLFMVIYGIPTFIMGILVNLLPIKKWGKKRLSFVLAFLCGIFTILIGTTSNIYGILSFVFVSSLFVGMSLILLSAVFEDYVARLNSFGNDMASLSQFSSNLAYTIGPILFGFLAYKFNYEITFVVTGSLIALVSIFSLFAVPRKVKMPQKDLLEVTD